MRETLAVAVFLYSKIILRYFLDENEYLEN